MATGDQIMYLTMQVNAWTSRLNEIEDRANMCQGNMDGLNAQMAYNTANHPDDATAMNDPLEVQCNLENSHMNKCNGKVSILTDLIANNNAQIAALMS